MFVSKKLRGRFRSCPRRLWWLLGVACLLGVVAGWLYSLSPTKSTTPPDSPEAWRELMRSNSHPARLAAAILLTGEGDAEGSKVILEMFPSLTPRELQTAVCALAAVADKNRLDPALIDLFLNASNVPEHTTVDLTTPGIHREYAVRLTNAIALIPPGKEKEHLGALRRAFERFHRNIRLSKVGGIYPNSW